MGLSMSMALERRLWLSVRSTYSEHFTATRPGQNFLQFHEEISIINTWIGIVHAILHSIPLNGELTPKDELTPKASSWSYNWLIR